MKLFDLHCDTIYECCETGKHLRENDLHINYAAAHRYQPYVQFSRCSAARDSRIRRKRATVCSIRPPMSGSTAC